MLSHGCHKHHCEVRGLAGFKNFLVRDLRLLLLAGKEWTYSTPVRTTLVIGGVGCTYCLLGVVFMVPITRVKKLALKSQIGKVKRLGSVKDQPGT